MDKIHLSSSPSTGTHEQVSVPGRARKIQKSDARARRQQSTVPVEALHHHADLQARRHYRGFRCPTGTNPNIILGDLT